jgi:hypothetical protein
MRTGKLKVGLERSGWMLKSYWMINVRKNHKQEWTMVRTQLTSRCR